MPIDAHVHPPARGPRGYLSPALGGRLGHRLWAARLGLEGRGGDPMEAFLQWLTDSSLDQAIVLALDAVHGVDGRRDLDRTLLAVDNDAVADLALAHPKVRFGASVHPYRRDALEELDRVAARGAVLVKWLPSAQGIDPAEPRCFPFYRRLAELGLPLLSHTGVEHTLGRFPDALNHPSRLEPALERGVTVIAAHCGTRLFLHASCAFEASADLALRHRNCYGDLSAFLASTRLPALQRILRSPELMAKVVYGSDFPAPAWPFNLLGLLGLEDYLRLRKLANPLERAYQSLVAVGLALEVFSRMEGLMRKAAPAHPGRAGAEGPHHPAMGQMHFE